MSEFDGLPVLRSPIVVAAFGGWNDADEAATGVIEHFAEQWKSAPLAALDPDDYYDFQVNRPITSLEAAGAASTIEWPTTRISYCSPPGSERDLVLVHGIEPNMRWRSYCEELLELFFALDVEQVVLLGALLSDTPHTRPVPVTGSASDAELMRRYDLEPSQYDGPTGIVGVLQEACFHAEIPAVSFWAQVPHYVSQPPCPKATLALIHRLEEVLNLRIPVGDLPEQAAGWESAINEAASEDDEMAEYVKGLEERGGDPQWRAPNGDELAREVEKYLRRPGGPTP